MSEPLDRRTFAATFAASAPLPANWAKATNWASNQVPWLLASALSSFRTGDCTASEPEGST